MLKQWIVATCGAVALSVAATPTQSGITVITGATVIDAAGSRAAIHTVVLKDGIIDGISGAYGR